MINQTELHALVAINHLTVQRTCIHSASDTDGMCGQPSGIKEFCAQHTPLYEKDHGKLFQTSMVKMERVNNQREVIATTELITGEILGRCPTFENVHV